MRFLRRLGVPTADLEDVTQEVFLVVHRQLPTFAGRSSLRTWIFGICTRTASNYQRKAYRRRERATAEPPTESAADDPHRNLAQRERAAWLLAALADLPEPQRQVFVLYELEDLSMPEVARVVGCPLSTAYSRLRSGRQRVRERARAMLVGCAVPVAAGAASPDLSWRSAIEAECLDNNVPTGTCLLARRLAPLLERDAAPAASPLGPAVPLIATALVAGGLLLLPSWPNAEFAPRRLAPLAAGMTPTRPAVAARPAPVEPPPREEVEPLQASPKPPRARAKRARALPAEPPPTTDPEAELELLRRAQRALGRSPGRALALAARHARDYPRGVFAQEREVVAIEAQLKLRRSGVALARARRFVERFPHSPHLHRVQALVERGRFLPRQVQARSTDHRAQ